jgi:hypothetical protein
MGAAEELLQRKLLEAIQGKRLRRSGRGFG